MRVGLGTGSTARWFIEALGERIAAGLRVHGVATSFVTQRLAEDHGITMHPLTRAGLDLAVDGADQVDPQLRVVKGAGGALVREKIVAAAAERFVVIVDDSKVVPRLSGAVPVELLTFGIEHTLALLDATGGRFATRITPDGELERSENGNLLADGMYGDIDDKIEFPKTPDEWASPRWYNFTVRQDPALPWLPRRTKRLIDAFETVMACRWPTIQDSRLSLWARAALKTLSWWRYTFNIYRWPLELEAGTFLLPSGRSWTMHSARSFVT